MRIIDITEIENIKIGNAQDFTGGTGCTVVICEKGAPAGVDIRGGGPASRETPLLNPLAAADKIHAILLGGGSAFGLDAAGGTMEYLEEKGIGFDAGITKVPLVCSSCLFDLVVGSQTARPDKKMGYDACVNAELNQPQWGNAGAGTGATVGKYRGVDYMMKSGLGSFAVQYDDLKIGAIAAVNALGDIFDWKTGQQLAGMLNDEKNGFLSTEELLYQDCCQEKNLFKGNTTLGIVITNGKFNKSEMGKIAAMAQNGCVRAIRPVHTTADGDAIYAMSTGDVEADINGAGVLAAMTMAEAIKAAVLSATPAYGLPTARDFVKIHR